MSRSVNITWRPLTQWPAGRAHTIGREEARFRSANRSRGPGLGFEPGKKIALSQTLDDLDRELWHIGARSVVVQIDVEKDRELSRMSDLTHVLTPAVVLTFVRRDVPHVIACDHFTRWQDNLRAIAKGLEALRLMERYHITQSGEQYRGWQALPASTTPSLSIEQAADVVVRRGGFVGGVIPTVLADRDFAKRAVRSAVARTHPDAGGSTTDFQLVQEAKRVLEAHHGGAL